MGRKGFNANGAMMMTRQAGSKYGGMVLLSLNNGWNDKDNISAAILDMAARCKRGGNRVGLLFCDRPALHNYRALAGTREQRERLTRSCRRSQANLRRICRRALELVPPHVTVQELTWETLLQEKSFWEERARVRAMYSSDDCLRTGVHQATIAALDSIREHHGVESSFPPYPPSRVRRAANFFLDEAAALRVAARILDVDRILVGYHKEMPLLQVAVSGSPKPTKMIVIGKR